MHEVQIISVEQVEQLAINKAQREQTVTWEAPDVCNR